MATFHATSMEVKNWFVFTVGSRFGLVNGESRHSLDCFAMASRLEWWRRWSDAGEVKKLWLEHGGQKGRHHKDASAVTYFHKLKTKRGFGKFLSLEKFNNPSKGYLVNDCCTFGAEVFVIQPSAQKEILTMVKRPNGRSYTWKIKKFSKLNDQVKWSDEFTVEGRKWRFFIYPKGNGSGSGKYLSLYMKLADWGRVLPKRKVYAEYKLRVLDHRGVKNVERACRHWFNSEEGTGYDFMLLKDIYKLSNGYLKDDTLTVHVEFGVISVTFSEEK
ncbi:hypothetical protein LWI29_026234 [Acer saccharum]|uniref:MATH domain-containing protein n=1 Tax=Acer saccharum TaxID=4024 RepID=A0AA39SQC3_ACESA|nr:hypothetical protein LWI29_026234 [Acer saccharum]